MAVQAASGIRALSVLVLPRVRLGRRAERHGVGNVLVQEVELDPVSYTHLTLPTIYSV